MTANDDAIVVVVEDERELADTYAEWLREYHTVSTAYTGEEALSAIDEEVDVVLLDRRLPDIPGRTVLQRIRAEGINARVAMITAVDPDFDIIEMPFDDYVVKPVLKAELHGIVDRLLKLSTYNDRFQESFALASKLRVLEDEKTTGELAESEDYTRIRARLDELSDGIDDMLADFDDQDFEALYRDLSKSQDDKE